MRTIVDSNEPDTVRLRHGQTLIDWWQHRKPGTSMNLDVIGGGYTAMFFEWDELTRPRPTAELPPQADSMG